MVRATKARANAQLPTLAYVYHPRSFATLSLVDAAQDVCELLWIVDSSQPEVTSMSRLLNRFGPTIDVAGLSYDEIASTVAQRNPQGILGLADDVLRFTAEIAARLGLAYSTPETALRLTDKFAQRAALANGGLVVPKSWIISEADSDATRAKMEEEVSFPAVFKPRRGEASRDTLPVGSLSELRALVKQFCSGEGPVREFVLEEYIPDSPAAVAGAGFAGYVSVESIVSDGRISHLAINGRMPPAFPFRETGFFIPSALDATQQAAVLEVASQAAAAIGVRLGCLHTEIKLTPSGPVVIEVNGRIGGGVPEMLEAATGIRLLSWAMRLSLGESIAVDELPHCNCLAYLFYVQAPAAMRRVVAVEGLDELRDVPGVDAIVLNRGPGQAVDWREGNHGHVFSVFGTAADHDELRKVNDLITNLVHIDGE